MSEMVRVYIVENESGDKYIDDNLRSVVSMVEGDLDVSETGQSFKITVGEMTRAGLDALPEFEGW